MLTLGAGRKGFKPILDAVERPSEQFEPLGSMIRSLEFQVGQRMNGIPPHIDLNVWQVGALFELMDAGNSEKIFP